MAIQYKKHFTQDLTKDVEIRQNCGQIVFNKDNLSEIISVDVLDNGQPVTITGSVVGAVIRADGMTVPITNGTFSGNTASITLTAASCAIPGQIGVGIQIISDEIKATVLKAIYNVELFETGNVIDPGSEITIGVGDLVNRIDQAVATIPAYYPDLMAALAPTFNTSTAYSKGQCVWYDGKLYQFTTAHPVGSWNADHVALFSVTVDMPTKAETYAAFATDTASGAVASFTDGADNIPMKTLTAAIEPVQTGTGNPSPENVRPISGWDEANVTRTGKNLFPSDISWTNGILDDNGNPISGASKYTDIIYGFKPDTSYTLQGSITNSNVSCRLYYRKLNGDWISRTGAINVIPYTFTTPANCGGIQLQISQSLNPTNIQIELGSTATSYEPYKGKTLSVNLKNATGSTVYGGTLTINSDGSGTVVVDMGFADLGTLDWTLVSGYFRTNGLNTLIKRISSTTEVPNALCSNYPVSYWNDSSSNVLVIAAATVASGVPFVWISDPAYTDATTFKSAMSGVQLVYELATPVTYTLTATQLRTLLGSNNVWADCGNVSVVYRADTGLYINKKISELAAQIVNS